MDHDNARSNAAKYGQCQRRGRSGDHRVAFGRGAGRVAVGHTEPFKYIANVLVNFDEVLLLVTADTKTKECPSFTKVVHLIVFRKQSLDFVDFIQQVAQESDVVNIENDDDSN